MTNSVGVFRPRRELEAHQNMAEFIDYCKTELSIYEDQGGFAADVWNDRTKTANYSLRFMCSPKAGKRYSNEPMLQPFADFAKAYVRYHQSANPVKTAENKIRALSSIHDILLDRQGTADPMAIDNSIISLVLTEIRTSLGESARYKTGAELSNLVSFLLEHGLTNTLTPQSSPFVKPLPRATRLDPESQKWREERCPSLEEMVAFADAFRLAETTLDKFWSSAIVFLMFAPGRVSELNALSVDCLVEGEKGALGVRWVGAKGFGDTIKWVPKTMEPAVRAAHARLVKIGAPARAAARHARMNPGKFYRHEGCATPEEFPEDEPLTLYQVCRALGIGPNVKPTNITGGPISKKYREMVGLTYAELAEKEVSESVNAGWPYTREDSSLLVEDTLIIMRKNENHKTRATRPFSWWLSGPAEVSEQISLKKRNRGKHIQTLLQRLGLKDGTGDDISLTSHQLRVWINTNAMRAGMDDWQLAKWSGRARVADNRHYDLRTEEELDQRENEIRRLTGRPTALEAIKLNLPVAYQDLGVDRIGVADVTEYGMCVHDYAMSPCSKVGECMTCREHVCVKGMPDTLEAIQRLESQIEQQLTKAKNDADIGNFGADRWVTHLGWKLAHVRTQRLRLEDENTPEGAVLWIPPENDPSEVNRALMATGAMPEPEDNSRATLADKLMSGLLGVDNA